MISQKHFVFKFVDTNVCLCKISVVQACSTVAKALKRFSGLLKKIQLSSKNLCQFNKNTKLIKMIGLENFCYNSSIIINIFMHLNICCFTTTRANIFKLFNSVVMVFLVSHHAPVYPQYSYAPPLLSDMTLTSSSWDDPGLHRVSVSARDFEK